MSNSPPLTTSAPGSNKQEIISRSTPGDSAYRLSSKKVFGPTSIRLEDGYNEKFLEPTRETLKEIPDLIYKELEIMFSKMPQQIYVCIQISSLDGVQITA
jgi:hypothetical protein